jgi:hypothetical protein
MRNPGLILTSAEHDSYCGRLLGLESGAFQALMKFCLLIYYGDQNSSDF